MTLRAYAIFLTCITDYTCSEESTMPSHQKNHQIKINGSIKKIHGKGMQLPYPSDFITCWRRSLTWAASSGANRNLVHLDCRAGMILLTLLHINANLVLFVCFSITAHQNNFKRQALQSLEPSACTDYGSIISRNCEFFQCQHSQFLEQVINLFSKLQL